MAFFKQLPKAELHAHLFGSIDAAFLEELNNEEPLLLPEELVLFRQPPQGWHETFARFGLVYKLIRTPRAIFRTTQRVLQDFVKDGVTHLELRTSLKELPEGDLTWDRYLATILQAGDEFLSANPSNLTLRWIVSVDRGKGPDHVQRTVTTTLRHAAQNSSIVGIDFCGDPHVGHFSEFVHPLSHARDQGLKFTAHFAEVPRFDDLHEILAFRPDRVGHACCMDEHLLNQLLESSIPVEICLSSNLRTGMVARAEQHIVKTLYRENHPIAICSDDSGIFCSRLSDEYRQAARLLGLDKQAILRLANAAFSYGFK